MIGSLSKIRRTMVARAKKGIGGIYDLISIDINRLLKKKEMIKESLEEEALAKSTKKKRMKRGA